MATEKGINITIRGFIPIDPHDLKGHRAKLDAVVEAEGGKLEALTEAGLRVEEFRADPVTRRGKTDAAEGSDSKSE
ncbi:hypothetical protein [Mesorhizobium sp. M2A.F.Ca.ET.039.01.1.1]|uniref:hypothetical protein n=1 Tax=Mesorhizobium sp. M2A.F.Ca.ET.039.01.1.1 TaxID=2496746 RepID=UPI000FCAD7BE|nr:hypothetical protein [Mesorhizobium sp. M2A.F.Ca.ET.039.01.1.1]RWX72523.1 hypothetical protein EOA24_00590 [Mesorhizobium sp. M2A.F.Ca.ET.039.01.1.1]